MKNFWKISIILTLYNKASYIEETLFSIYNQSYKNWELILVDDCSVDWSFMIAKSFCEKIWIIDRCIFIRNKNNLWVSKTFEKWLELSEWDWVSMCDWDDILMRDHLEKKIEFCERNNYNFCCWWCVDIDENNNFLGFRNKWLFWSIHKIYLKERTYKNTLILPNAIWSAIFFSKSFKEKLLKVWFPEGVFQDFWSEVYASLIGEKIWYINDNLFYHRRCNNCITVYREWSLRSYEEYYKQRICIADYLTNNSILLDNSEKWIQNWKLINAELLKYIQSTWKFSFKPIFLCFERGLWFKPGCILLYQYLVILLHKFCV